MSMLLLIELGWASLSVCMDDMMVNMRSIEINTIEAKGSPS